MRWSARRGSLALALILACSVAAIAPASASASQGQETMFQDTARLLTDPAGTLSRLRLLGVSRVRLFMPWEELAPHSSSHKRPNGFRSADPKSYSDATWATWDAVIEDAQADGIGVNLDLGGGAPLWATGPGAPQDKPHPNWNPSPGEYGAFVHAVATRYSGTYDPTTHKSSPGALHDLPAVRFWSIWNEPDYGPSLAPQGAPGRLTIQRSPWMYRNLVDAAWKALRATGHGHDTIIFGELAPRGYPHWGVFSGMKPLPFLRAMYCVDSRYHELRGAAARVRGCPTTAAGSRAFRTAHPALFQASGVSDHPYSRWYPPNVEATPDPDYSTLAEINVLERGLDRLQRVYGSHTRFPIWNTEYGYITGPPKHPTKKVPYISPSTAAYYINWAEYISWRNPRLKSFAQYLLADPLPALASNDFGGFASGLLTFKGAQKPTYSAFRLPLFVPVTSARRGRSLDVWGAARPAHFSTFDTRPPQLLKIQLQSGSRGAFNTVKTITITDPHGYFDTRVTFGSSGTVRLTWSYPPADAYSQPYAVYSRHVKITLH